jgi:hypothetical protein
MFYIKIDGHILAECFTWRQALNQQTQIKRGLYEMYRSQKKKIPHERINQIRIHNTGINPT